MYLNIIICSVSTRLAHAQYKHILHVLICQFATTEAEVIYIRAACVSELGPQGILCLDCEMWGDWSHESGRVVGSIEKM